MFKHSNQITCIIEREGGIRGEKGGRGVVGREVEIKYKLLSPFLNKLNKQLFTFAFILLFQEIYGINSV